MAQWPCPAVSQYPSAPFVRSAILPLASSNSHRALCFSARLPPTPTSTHSCCQGKLIKAEEREVGHVSTEVYKEWVKGAGGSHFLFVIVALYILGETARVGSSFWLGVWASDHFDRAYWGCMSVSLCVYGCGCGVWEWACVSVIVNERTSVRLLCVGVWVFVFWVNVGVGVGAQWGWGRSGGGGAVGVGA